MTAFAELTATMNDRIVEFLADAEAVFGWGGIVQGIFRNPPAQAFGMIEGCAPTFEAVSDDLAGADRGDSATINGTAYIVAEKRTDAGMTTLVLEEV